MKKILDIIVSPQATAVLLLLFSVAMGVATFVEEAYDIPTGKALVYNAKWFELIMVLLAVNFVGNIKRYNLFRKEKIANLMFHMAFIVIILGAGFTRYFGFEGVVRIREGKTTNILYSEKTSFRILAEDKDKTYKFEQVIAFNGNTENSFNATIPTESLGDIKVNLKSFVPNAIEEFLENQPDGINTLEITAAINNQRSVFRITEGGFSRVGRVKVAYNEPALSDAIQITESSEGILIKSPYSFVRAVKGGHNDTIPADSAIIIQLKEIVSVNGEMFMVDNLFKKAKKRLRSDISGSNRSDAVILEVMIQGKSHEVTVFGGKGYMGDYQTYNLDGNTIRMAYGDAPIILPFSIKLDDFILDRYAGSMSPSSFESKVTLIDTERGINEPHRIYMNNVLDYRGYRFFQSSYDQDEKGTILSANHDFVGTWISYLGYIMLAIGFVLIFFNKASRFTELKRKIKAIQVKRKQGLLTILFLIGATSLSFGQSAPAQNAISEEYANEVGQLVVQTYNGRFAPLQTLADDIMHKVSRKDKFEIEGKGTLTKMQAFLDIQLDPTFWKTQKLIYIREESVRNVLGLTGKYASFDDFFDSESKYILQQYSEKAFRKKPVEQNKFDKEIIKVDERVNVFMMTLNGSISKLFPVQNSKNNNWVSWMDEKAQIPLTGAISIINDGLGLKDFTYANIMRSFFSETEKAIISGNYSEAQKVLGYIKTIQNQKAHVEGFPSESQLKFEVFYNKANIFIMLKNVYGVLCILLLIFAFMENLTEKPGKWVGITLNIFIGMLVLAFLYHTFGMALRWYLTGHAPWSNGYEALLLVAWGSLLAGFAFMKNSKIIVAAASLLAFFMLMTAGHSSYDPQLTNLQPVLKSYWLVIHVAIMTISYGFLGSGFLLGLINLVLYSTKNKRNTERFNSVITELSYINEMITSVGVFMATIGTFLGGVWANESWGRYWGWDAKETWALVIVMVYAAVLHMRMIPKLKNLYWFNVGSVWAFSTVLMTFIGVNYYLSKGLHSYGAGDTPIFPIWAWVLIGISLALSIYAGRKELSGFKPEIEKEEE